MRPLMPTWLQYLLWAAALVTAIGVLWQRVVKPGFNVANTADEMLPLLRELTAVFHNDPSNLRVLNEIASQFRTDSGSSLRDVVNRLEAALNRIEAADAGVADDLAAERHDKDR